MTSATCSAWGPSRLKQQIDLVIKLEVWDDTAVYDRLGLESAHTEILGVQVPAITIPVKPGRNLASIVEVAAMNNRHRRYGFNAAQELAQRVGVRRETIGHLENGHYNPSLKLAMDIAHVFGCTVEDIFFFED
mgnify:CR=1 FL=1